MPTEVIFEVQDEAEGGYSARALDYPIFTQAESLDELRQMVRDAVRLHFEDGARPAVIRLHRTFDELISA